MKNIYRHIFIAWLAFLAIEYILTLFLGSVSGTVIPLFIDESAPNGDVEKAITMLEVSSTIIYYLASLIAFFIAIGFLKKYINNHQC